MTNAAIIFIDPNFWDAGESLKDGLIHLCENGMRRKEDLWAKNGMNEPKDEKERRFGWAHSQWEILRMQQGSD